MLLKARQRKQITFDEEIRDGKYWTGKEYVYNKDDILEKVKLYTEGKHTGDAKIEEQ